jgi:signal transduction histidine kinase
VSDSRIELLQKAFPGLSTEAASEVLQHVQENTYPPNTNLCKEGATEDIFYLMVRGQVAITKWMEFAGEDRFLRHSEVGDFFGEMAIINDAPRAATVRTTQETTVLEMGRADFMRLISSSPTMALAMVRIIIERMRSNDKMQFEELRRTYESLQKLDKAKLDFIEVAAHELRTPLTVIQGYAKLIDLSVSDHNLHEASQGMLEGVARMLQVVNSMLDITKIDNQVLKVAPVPVLTKLLMAEPIQTFRKALDERNISLRENNTCGNRLPIIYADPGLLNKLFYQLLSNAIKYTPDGGAIEILLEETYDSRIGGHGLHVVIMDSGVGIKHEHLPHIFEKFFQGGDVNLHSSSKTAFMGGGPGLGLAIANGIVQAHQGEIWVEGRENQSGTSFHILLPINHPAKRA